MIERNASEDCQDRTARTGLPQQGCLNRTARKRQAGYHNHLAPLSSVAEPEPEPQGAATFAGAGAVTLIKFLAPAPCYKLVILKSFLVTDSTSCIFVHGHPFFTVY
jgi:hypothetical protein